MNENKSINSLKKQLVAAVAMVLVAAVALGSSTYAWFVSNNKVTADGLTVKATSEAGLLIRHGESAYATSAQGRFTTSQVLYPTSTVIGATWFHAAADKADVSTAAEGTMKTLTGITAGSDGVGKLDEKAYYIVDSFDIYTTGKATDLKVSNIDVLNKNDGFDKSLRLLFVCGTDTNQRAYVVAPGYTGESNIKYTVGINPDGSTNSGTEVTAYTVDTNKNNSLAANVSTNKDQPTTVTVYAYFEGEDTNHTTDSFNAATSVHDLAITLTFEANVSSADATTGA